MSVLKCLVTPLTVCKTLVSKIFKVTHAAVSKLCGNRLCRLSKHYWAAKSNLKRRDLQQALHATLSLTFFFFFCKVIWAQEYSWQKWGKIILFIIFGHIFSTLFLVGVLSKAPSTTLGFSQFAWASKLNRCACGKCNFLCDNTVCCYRERGKAIRKFYAGGFLFL